MKFCIRGYDVEFPQQPYGVQLSFMEKLLRTLDEQGNALLEAPTGCGKTLSLLCAALAWQTRRKKELFDKEAGALARSRVRGDDDEDAFGATPSNEKQHRPSHGSDSDDEFRPATSTDGSQTHFRGKKYHGHTGTLNTPGAGCASASPKRGSAQSPRSSEGKVAGHIDNGVDAMDDTQDDTSEGDHSDQPGGGSSLPRIFFATRTHSQIAQVVRELKRSGYKPTMAILAAKTHYCINKAVKRTGRVDEECERLMKEETHGCRFRNRGAGRGGRPPEAGLHDIEELSQACTRARTCPYFAARDMALTAELVFCPYSYLLDPLVRAALSIDVRGSVLIFDEAHNMEDVCREGGSTDVDLDALREAEVSFRLAAQLTGRPELYSPLAEAVGRLGALLGRFESSTEGMVAAGFEEHEAVWQGPRALGMLSEAGLNPPAVKELYRLYDQAKAYEDKATFTLEGDAANEAVPASVTRPGAGGAAMGILGRLLTVLRLMYGTAPSPPPPPRSHLPPPSQYLQQQQFVHSQPHPYGLQHPQQQQRPQAQWPSCQSGPTSASVTATGGGFIPAASPAQERDKAGGEYGKGGRGGVARAPAVPPPSRDNSGDYRVVVRRWIAHGTKDRRKDRSRKRRGNDEEEDGGSLCGGGGLGSGAAVSLGLWCFNPAVAFRDLADKAHSVVLTSGTLAPLDSFASELGTEFHTRLEAPHVVDMSRQVWIGVVPRGPGGSLLSATFRQSCTFAFQDDAGEAVLRCCQAIADGVLLFLPSYGLLDKLAARWKSTGLWSRLEAAKTVVVEPREAGKGFDEAMARFYAAVRGGHGGLFLAVCRGKASEGIDFADQFARGVILLGIPFPAIKDTKVKLKKEYNNAGCGPSSGRPLTQRLLSGDAWYNQQAFRALNQAVGRCIRHKYDWGAIILMDERFRSTGVHQHLSRWMRTAVKVHEDFATGIREVEAFCSGLINDPPRQPPTSLPHLQPHAHTAVACEAAAAASGAAATTLKQRERGRKGSIYLQYEEEVVIPPELKGSCEKGVGGIGTHSSIEGHFDHFRMATLTPPPPSQTAVVEHSGAVAGNSVAGKQGSTRPITSFFPQLAVVQNTAKLGAIGVNVPARGGCCGGVGGDDNACGDEAPAGRRFPGSACALRVHNGNELALMSQPATQPYQAAVPHPGWTKEFNRPVVHIAQTARWDPGQEQQKRPDPMAQPLPPHHHHEQQQPLPPPHFQMRQQQQLVQQEALTSPPAPVQQRTQYWQEGTDAIERPAIAAAPTSSGPPPYYLHTTNNRQSNLGPSVAAGHSSAAVRAMDFRSPSTSVGTEGKPGTAHVQSCSDVVASTLAVSRDQHLAPAPAYQRYKYGQSPLPGQRAAGLLTSLGGDTEPPPAQPVWQLQQQRHEQSPPGQSAWQQQQPPPTMHQQSHGMQIQPLTNTQQQASWQSQPQQLQESSAKCKAHTDDLGWREVSGTWPLRLGPGPSERTRPQPQRPCPIQMGQQSDEQLRGDAQQQPQQLWLQETTQRGQQQHEIGQQQSGPLQQQLYHHHGWGTLSQSWQQSKQSEPPPGYSRQPSSAHSGQPLAGHSGQPPGFGPHGKQVPLMHLEARQTCQLPQQQQLQQHECQQLNWRGPSLPSTCTGSTQPASQAVNPREVLAPGQATAFPEEPGPARQYIRQTESQSQPQPCLRDVADLQLQPPQKSVMQHQRQLLQPQGQLVHNPRHLSLVISGYSCGESSTKMAVTHAQGGWSGPQDYCRKVGRLDTQPRGPKVAANKQDNALTSEVRPTKRLTSNRAREAASKRQRMQPQTAAQQYSDRNDFAMEDPVEDNDDFV